jgi:hypothetical protein
MIAQKDLNRQESSVAVAGVICDDARVGEATWVWVSTLRCPRLGRLSYTGVVVGAVYVGR